MQKCPERSLYDGVSFRGIRRGIFINMGGTKKAELILTDFFGTDSPVAKLPRRSCES